jgi:hypothetical protein
MESGMPQVLVENDYKMALMQTQYVVFHLVAITHESLDLDM